MRASPAGSPHKEHVTEEKIMVTSTVTWRFPPRSLPTSALASIRGQKQGHEHQHHHRPIHETTQDEEEDARSAPAAPRRAHDGITLFLPRLFGYG